MSDKKIRKAVRPKWLRFEVTVVPFCTDRKELKIYVSHSHTVLEKGEGIYLSQSS